MSNVSAVRKIKPDSRNITKDDVKSVQQEWADGIVKISQVYIDDGDYKNAAKDHIERLYAYGLSDVLFKPTLAAENQFRPTFDGALSYFVGGIIEEDQGFAIRPWKAARFGDQEILINSDSAIAMGNYYFTPADGSDEIKVEFTLGYIKDSEGNLRINLHHSSLPYDG